jgi:hypothetical protein
MAPNGPSMLRRLRRRPRETPFNTDRQHYESWHVRAVDAVSLWVDARGSWRASDDRPLRIADYGAGSERLRDLLGARLEQPFDYFPFDLHPQKRTTVRLNVLEETPEDRFDVVFALGLLEYLPPDSDFLQRLRSVSRFALASYTYVGSTFTGTSAEREALGWRVHHDRETFEREFAESGFSLVDFRATQDGQAGLWLWDSRSSAP